jgi:hypothetical protein
LPGLAHHRYVGTCPWRDTTESSTSADDDVADQLMLPAPCHVRALALVSSRHSTQLISTRVLPVLRQWMLHWRAQQITTCCRFSGTHVGTRLSQADVPSAPQLQRLVSANINESSHSAGVQSSRRAGSRWPSGIESVQGLTLSNRASGPNCRRLQTFEV